MENDNRQFSWVEAEMIKGKAVMAQHLAAFYSQEANADALSELSALIYDPELTYTEIVETYFFKKDKSLKELVNSPFVNAFTQTSQCTSHEVEIIQKVRKAVTLGSVDSGVVADFEDLVRNRMHFISEGVKVFTLYSGVIEPLGAIGRKKTNIKAAIWRDQNPERAAEIRQKARELAAIAGPRVYTEEVRDFIQIWFNEGLTYDEVVKLLEDQDAGISYRDLIFVVNYYNMDYVVGRQEGERVDKLRTLVRENFPLHKTRNDVIEAILTMDLGYSKTQIGRVISEHGLRNRLDWEGVIEVGDKQTSLQSLMNDFRSSSAGKYSQIKDQFAGFVLYLKDLGIEVPNLTEGAYRGIVRRRKD